MVRALESIVCIAASSTLAFAACYEIFYVDEACQLNRCPDPAVNCDGANPHWINNAPVYTSNQVEDGHDRVPIDYLCRIQWKTKDNLGVCSVVHTCDRWTGGYAEGAPCKKKLA